MLLTVNEEIAKDLEVLDLNSGEFLRGVFEANQETGEYKQYKFDRNGDIAIIHNDFDYTIKKGNIILVYKGE